MITWSLQILWAVSGLILTVICTFWQVVVFVPVSTSEFVLRPLDVTWQVGAVLFTGCVGGKVAAVLSQVGYILLGLVGLHVFYQGGGGDYLHSPALGYLLGFVLGGAVCGHWAFAKPATIEHLGLSCGLGLIAIHFVGISWLILRGFPDIDGIVQKIQLYSVHMFPSQLGVACAIAVLAGLVRLLLFY